MPRSRKVCSNGAGSNRSIEAHLDCVTIYRFISTETVLLGSKAGSRNCDNIFRALWHALRNHDLIMVRELTLAAVEAVALCRYEKTHRSGICNQLNERTVTIRLRVHCANGGPLTARDFASKTPPKPLQKHMAKEISDYVFDLMPAPTEVFRHAKRGTWIHRYFDSIKDAGMKFA